MGRHCGVWHNYNSADTFTCRDCGRVDRGYYVQPQPEGYALCGDCIGKQHAEWRARRKAELAACPRCEVKGCGRRGNWKTVGGLLLCGPHLKRAQARLAGFGIFGMAVDMNRASVLAMASDRGGGR